ncbi:MAG: sigma 54-interacting transcriptional regulator, partial [Myxococcota bacterium]|nr:sigma 54-interacting transcriptional regulator [Myxococcota bacterium]
MPAVVDTPVDRVLTPGILMVARGVTGGTEATALALPADVALGRRIVAAAAVHAIDDERMSRDHATVRRDGGQWVITDLASRNGSFVSGQRITGEVRRRGDLVLRLGHTVFLLLGDITGHPAATGGAVGPELARAHARVRRAASADTLLITGECARARATAAHLFHDASARRAGPFITVSCSRLPEGVSERLLFGAQKGVVESIGHFQMARGGTIFLDEVEALEPAVQTKLERLIEHRRVEPIGVPAGLPIDVGVVAGADHELRLAVAEHRFAAALHRQLAQLTVQLPALRERKVDAARIVQVAAAEAGVVPHAKFLEACLIRGWPGEEDELIAAVRDAARTALAAGSGV